ncbi:sporulation histidine kinase inhibitor Sda [Alteribacillus bidgolensis]|uniref:Sporulation inhibitor A n=1 Tax=Alteribacillus bidgolensis TaxID=930129 RepID=A0A1G8FN99_9BACI|nr:sporulation histidine kinase inhibitor Sda [Alteribacillus bidgolensis]SDH83615.1 Sporulation inhibitor A [Alteribacillus bidgolensis]
MGLEEMSISVLVETSEKAKELELDNDFINILEEALKKRYIHQ